MDLEDALQKMLAENKFQIINSAFSDIVIVGTRKFFITIKPKKHVESNTLYKEKNQMKAKHQFQPGEKVFVFAPNAYGDIFLRETLVWKIYDLSVRVEAFGEYKNENVYRSESEAYDAIINELNSMRNKVDVALNLSGFEH